MTTIAIKVYPDKVVVASDTYIAGGFPGKYTKHLIFKNKICGTSGSSPWTFRFEEWFLAGMPKDRLPKIDEKACNGEFSAFTWDEKRGILWYPTGDVGMKINALHYAEGSGAPYALGAMEMGATPEDAVKIACHYDKWSKLPVRVATLERKKK